MLAVGLLTSCSTSSLTVAHSTTNAVVASLEVAIQQYHDGQLDEAAQTLRTVLRDDPKNVAASRYLGLVNWRRYERQKAAGDESIMHDHHHVIGVTSVQ
jgi:Tfp pilus assembly protein PilF